MPASPLSGGNRTGLVSKDTESHRSVQARLRAHAKVGKCTTIFLFNYFRKYFSAVTTLSLSQSGGASESTNQQNTSPNSNASGSTQSARSPTLSRPPLVRSLTPAGNITPRTARKALDLPAVAAMFDQMKNATVLLQSEGSNYIYYVLSCLFVFRNDPLCEHDRPKTPARPT